MRLSWKSFVWIFKVWDISAAHRIELQFVIVISTVCVLLWASGQCSPCDSCGDTAGSSASPHQHNHISKCYTCQSISRGGVSICSIHTGLPFKKTVQLTQGFQRRHHSGIFWWEILKFPVKSAFLSRLHLVAPQTAGGPERADIQLCYLLTSAHWMQIPKW